MMFKIVVALLAVFFTVDGIQGSVVVGISRSTRAKLDIAINETIEAKRQSSVEVDALKNLVERKIDILLEPIEKDLKELKCKVKKADKRAKADGSNISRCVQQARKGIHEFNRDILKVCADTREVTAATQKLDDIGNLVRALRYAPKACANKGLLANTCVITIIDSSRQKALVLQDEISVILRHIRPDERSRCVSKATEHLESQVEKISDEWYECLQRHEVDFGNSA